MGDNFSVLLVEDSEDDAELVLRFVRQYEKNMIYKRVDRESDVLEALTDQQWNLVISDYNLPSLSGLDVMKIFLDSGQDIPFIIVSGMIGEETAIEAVKSGATDYVLKSNLGRLPAAIDRAMKDLVIKQKLRKMQQNLIQAQKMEAVGRFAGGLAHDVNNILTAITLYAELALKQIHTNPDNAEKNIQDLLKSTKTAVDIIQQILMFSRKKNEVDKSRLDMCKLLTNFESIIRRLLDKKIDLVINTPSEPLMLMANQTQLEQILLNLAVNAKDAMSNEGLLIISTERRELNSGTNNAIPIEPGNYIVLTVTDTGCGMSEEVCGRIFEPYFSTKDYEKGTGLGLSVIYGIVQQMKGGILVESIPDQGTSFHVYLPSA